MHPIQEIVKRNKAGRPIGIYSCCSANGDVIRASIRKAKKTNTIVLIESTSNQVNQEGGYTGMTPADFARFVEQLAAEENLSMDRIILGGDHLGPLPWCEQMGDTPMQNAEVLVASCVMAGYSKIHLDTSMRIGDDDQEAPLPVSRCAKRGARLCLAAEKAFAQYKEEHPEALAPVYVLGSEVPIPGGASDGGEMGVTKVEDCSSALEEYKKAFADLGLEDVFSRVVGFVIEMGVEFHEYTLDEYDTAAAQEVCSFMAKTPIAIEGHSTDYQTRSNLRQMCKDGCCILKVGPAFTFGLREALFSLEGIERNLFADQPEKLSNFSQALEKAMLDNPKHWGKYYRGTENQQKISRAYSFYDRARYYMPVPEVVAARNTLLGNLDNGVIPLCMLSQYMPAQYYRIREGVLENNAFDILLDRIGDMIDDYLYATQNNSEM